MQWQLGFSKMHELLIANKSKSEKKTQESERTVRRYIYIIQASSSLFFFFAFHDSRRRGKLGSSVMAIWREIAYTRVLYDIYTRWLVYDTQRKIV